MALRNLFIHPNSDLCDVHLTVYVPDTVTLISTGGTLTIGHIPLDQPIRYSKNLTITNHHKFLRG